MLEKVEKELDTSVKASLGEYIRLVQLQKDLEEEEVKEIKVTWVEPEEGAKKTVREERPESGN